MSDYQLWTGEELWSLSAIDSGFASDDVWRYLRTWGEIPARLQCWIHGLYVLSTYFWILDC